MTESQKIALVREEAARVISSRRPKGCDQQGRHPEAAEACTELGADDRRIGWGAFLPIVLSLTLVAVGAAVALWLAP